MSVGLYDDAFVEKLRKWTKDTDVTILTPNDTRGMFSIIADSKNDAPIELPIISLKRPNGYSVLRKGANNLSYVGARISATSELGKRLRAIPISIPYQIDIYTRYRDEMDEYTRNIVYNIINYPKLEIDIPYYDVHYKHYSNIYMAGDVEDTSDIPERLVEGQFVRSTIQIVVDDAYLFDINLAKTKKVCPNCVDVVVKDD